MLSIQDYRANETGMLRVASPVGLISNKKFIDSGATAGKVCTYKIFCAADNVARVHP